MRLLVLLFFLIAGIVYGQESPELSPIGAKIKAAMDSDIRSEEERARDVNRRPIETLEFFGLRDDMRVLELVPGSGWYTKLLGPVLAEEGELYLALGTSRIRPLLQETPGLDKVTVLAVDATVTPTDISSIVDISGFTLDVEDLDLVLTFRNLHNLTEASRGMVNAAVFKALKPGGHYGIVDHTRRHMEPLTTENRRRADPVVMIKEIEDAGFEFVDFSDLHHRPDDELRYEVGRKSVTGNTDRFTLLFRKPE